MLRLTQQDFIIIERRGWGLEDKAYNFENVWAVVGVKKEDISSVMRSIIFINEKNVITESKGETFYDVFLEDGTIRWIPEMEGVELFHFGKLYCSKDISKDFLKINILPMYTGKKKDIVWIKG